jgi:hypothetical protein
MMEAVRTSETSVDNHFTRQYIPEDNSEHHTRRRENLNLTWISFGSNLNLNFAAPPYLKASSNKNDSNKTCRYVHDILLYKTLFVQVQQFVILNFSRPSRPYFWSLTKVILLKVVYPPKISSAHLLAWSHVDWWKFCIHIINLTVRHFWNGRYYGIQKYGNQATFNGMKFLLNLIAIKHLVL